MAMLLADQPDIRKLMPFPRNGGDDRVICAAAAASGVTVAFSKY
jgi:H+/Cl- antiporter ClcA